MPRHIPNISNARIQALMDEAGTAGDLDQVRICQQALAGNVAARRVCAKVIAAKRVRNTTRRSHGFGLRREEAEEEWARGDMDAYNGVKGT